MRGHEQGARGQGVLDRADSLCKIWKGACAEEFGCDPTSLPPGPPAGRRPLPLSRRRREMSSNKEQRSAVFVVVFALITILIVYSSNSAHDVFRYGSPRGRTRRPVDLKKWSITDAYVPILGNKGKVPFVVEHRLVHHGDCSRAV
ncbi:alpha-N-acetylgalactosaminide alpha-2,6-sialyltransferase 6 isoform X5 [Eumetopias jubatus]|uniref:alpha-N-acetylgalactosaminide alpha-2,6-sialyltransferase 6 isoform X5 n=1 Tax=Eumetopias jubatus TaxID=34886 RepID=UPI001015E7D4|nr:alpha-N-acetylgalactosaminide alpha-2,6-sialyltransferase 6 isoform X5 [Eumetopias jubatus]XP_027963632.1 alpha-N-acetylgalactosaminide alpha-2,6-sialyltransferase 6 isoform X5 [Eumetopias jubatus]